ncbi:MAG: AAA family ATPase [Cellvibrionaceae bacterium]|nr:AAA family ATPase [Cellvibrionaceae bacterium]
MSQEIDQVAHADRQPVSASALSKDSLSQYGVAKDPFGDTLTADNFFYGAERRHLLDQALHLCQFGNHFVVVTGDAGVGKTAFLHQVRRELSETALCVYLDGKAIITASDLFTQLAARLRLPLAGDVSADAFAALVYASAAEDETQRIILLDDADHLGEEAFATLIALLQDPGNKYFHLLMSAKYSLTERFAPLDTLVCDLALAPLTEAQVKDYVTFKMVSAGYRGGDDLFDASTLHALWRETQGFPGALNRAAQTIFFEQDMRTEGSKDKALGLPLLHMAGLILLLAALLFALFYVGTDEEAAPAPTALADRGGDGAPDIKVAEIQTPEVHASEPPAPTAQPPVQAASESAAGQARQQVSAAVADVAVSDELGAAADAALPSLTEGTSAASAVTPQPVEATAAVVASEPVVESAPAADVPPVSERVPAVANKTPAVESQAPAPVAAPSALTAAEQAVLAWPDGHYTLQVIAAASRQGLVDFVARQPNRQDLQLITLNRQGKPWHIVLKGAYPTKARAREAIQSLPQNQVNGAPWPRSVQEIKRQIKAFRNI